MNLVYMLTQACMENWAHLFSHRRIYDITNVLEGTGLLEKKSKNQIKWKAGVRISPDADDEVTWEVPYVRNAHYYIW